jgi:hypothetical protein
VLPLAWESRGASSNEFFFTTNRHLLQDKRYNECFMPTCWAESLGNCCNKQSREHPVSKSLFSSGVVDVHGFPWCKEKPAQVGIASLTAKILCRHHNSELSSLDEAALQAFGVFQEACRLTEVRQKMKPTVWNIKKYRINGPKLERWFLKTLINLCFDRGHAIGRDSQAEGRPSERLVRIAYGLEPFQGKAGLYSVSRVGMNINWEDVVQFVPLFKNNLNVEAAIFSFRGWMMLLFLENEGPPPPLTGVYMNDEHLADSTLGFHSKQINVGVGKHISHRIFFDW